MINGLARRLQVPASLRKMAKKAVLGLMGISRDLSWETERIGEAEAPWEIDVRDLGPDAVVYSFGISNETEFEETLTRKFGAEVFAYDPTPLCKTHIAGLDEEVRKKIHFHPYAIGGNDETTLMWARLGSDGQPTYFYNKRPSGKDGENLEEINWETRSLGSLMEENGHQKIDLLKLDIEGAEFEVLELVARKKTPVRQIAVEMHYRFPEIGLRSFLRLVKSLRAAGYGIAAISDWGEEFLFVKR